MFFWSTLTAFGYVFWHSPRISSPLLFDISINNLCELISHSFFFSYDDLKVFRVIKLPRDCLLFAIRCWVYTGWCLTNFMKLNLIKTRYFFTMKTNIVSYQYTLCNDILHKLYTFNGYLNQFRNLKCFRRQLWVLGTRNFI
jgi:hypothetical protein